jgi:RHS repeat-associated protein
MQRGTTTDYYEADGVGSVTSLTATDGTVAESYTYDSFGNTTNSPGSLTNFLRYTAREFDTETGLYYYRARYYDPNSGKFLSEDPFRFNAGVNFYEYAADEPTNFVDPYGLQNAPRGPMHPNGSYACTWNDDCATLSQKIALFKDVIADHMAWDAMYNPGRHDQEIGELLNGLANCIRLHQQKCTNKTPCNQPNPVPQSAPSPTTAPQGAPLLPGIITTLENILQGVGEAAGALEDAAPALEGG